jgi:hypothetical protein
MCVCVCECVCVCVFGRDMGGFETLVKEESVEFANKARRNFSYFEFKIKLCLELG